MSGAKDPFEILADEITLIRRQIDGLQRTSLDKDEAERLNAVIAQGLDRMANVGKRLEQHIEGQLQLALANTHQTAVAAAQDAARGAIRESHAEILRTAQSLSQAAGEARREAWRHFGGFWVWLASIGAAGAVLGLLMAFWITGRGDAREFGQFPRIYCGSAGGQIVERQDGSSFCAIWINQPPQAVGE